MTSRSLSLLLLLACPLLTRADDVPAIVGRFPQEIATSSTTDDGLPSNDVRHVFLSTDGAILAETSQGWAAYRNHAWSSCDAPKQETLVGHIDPQRYATIAKIVNQVAQGPDGRLVAATQKGLLIERGDAFEPLRVEDGQGRTWGTSDVRGVAFDSQGRLWFTTPAGIACRSGQQWQFHTGAEGVPYCDFTVIAPGRDGAVWFGTHLGVVRFDQRGWHYRQGRRWLPQDDIRDLVVDATGSVWFATSGGVGCIAQRPMTLAKKAAYYEDEIDRFLRRTPLGYVAEVRLGRPADKSQVQQYDTDNDGLWTAMYGAGECFAYGATKSPKAQERARQAFEALRFLQKVTQGGEHSPPKGYVARTIRPVEWPDPNQGRLESDRQIQASHDPHWKVYEPRWPKSADGRWYWKSDTSSDELDGHYFFYPLYYDLVADTDAEKERVREVVRDLTDHLIEHDYCLVDHDGRPTRWAVYGPEALNHDPQWWPERGLKSLSMLSYLAAAQHITGDAKYGEHLQKLVREHGYLTNAMIYKIHRGIGSGNQSDDEMAFMCFYNLAKYAPDDALREQLLFSFYSAWVVEQPEMNPFFNFAYAAFGRTAQYHDLRTPVSLAPWQGWLDDSLATLQGFPLDRLDWASTNSQRSDLVRLSRHATRELSHADWTGGIGYRINGKVLPVENRHFNHWNTDPWRLDYPGDGQTLGSGTVYLLPYYLGLYHGFLKEKPE